MACLERDSNPLVRCWPIVRVDHGESDVELGFVAGLKPISPKHLVGPVDLPGVRIEPPITDPGHLLGKLAELSLFGLDVGEAAQFGDVA